MSLLVTLLLTAGGTTAAWAWLALLTNGARWRRWGLVAALAGAAAAAYLSGRWLPVGWAGKVAAAMVVLALGSAAGYRLERGPSWPWQRRRAFREDRRQASLHLALLAGAAVFSLPFAWMLLTSFKPDDQIFSRPVSLPDPWLWSNYPKTFTFLEMALPIGTDYGLRFVGNTLIVTTLSLATVLVSSSLVAYSFARLRWPGRDLLFVVLLATMMIPPAVTMIPRFLIYQRLGWIDTLQPLWFEGLFAGAFNVFLLRQFFMTIPSDLEDAARIDGCGYFGIYWRVMLPLIKPALAALAIMQFMHSWNDFMGPLIYLSSPEKLTGSYALQIFRGNNSGEWALLMAAASLWTVPVVVLFFFTQRYFIQGITLTGMGGR
jgi:multiple sugar transport system permease protein